MYTRIRQKYAMEEGLVPIVLTSKPLPWEGVTVSSYVVVIKAASAGEERGRVLSYRCRRVISKKNLVGFRLWVRYRRVINGRMEVFTIQKYMY